jgi:hypothetical protein
MSKAASAQATSMDGGVGELEDSMLHAGGLVVERRVA